MFAIAIVLVIAIAKNASILVTCIVADKCRDKGRSGVSGVNLDGIEKEATPDEDQGSQAMNSLITGCPWWLFLYNERDINTPGKNARDVFLCLGPFCQLARGLIMHGEVRDSMLTLTFELDSNPFSQTV